MCALSVVTGVSINCWRASIGLFNARYWTFHYKTCKNDTYFLLYILTLIAMASLLLRRSLIFQISFGLVVLFTYSACGHPVPSDTYDVFYSGITEQPFTRPYFFTLKTTCYLYIFRSITLIPKSIHFMVSSVTRCFQIVVFDLRKNIFFLLNVISGLLILAGNVEKNPGPLYTKLKNFSFAVWNLDSIPARDYARIPLIETFQAIHNVDIFVVCESSLTSDIFDNDILINGFSSQPFRSDKPPHIRNGGVCL